MIGYPDQLKWEGGGGGECTQNRKSLKEKRELKNVYATMTLIHIENHLFYIDI